MLQCIGLLRNIFYVIYFTYNYFYGYNYKVNIVYNIRFQQFCQHL